MSFASIQQLKTALIGRGARANLFEIDISFPTLTSVDASLTGTTFTADAQVLCKAAAVPGFTVGTIEVPFRAGRRIKIPGDRTFADWTVTIINDENQKLRRAFNAWVNLISKGNYDSATKSSATAEYYKPITCKHLKADNTVSRQYQLVDAFPTDVSAIDLSFDSTDTLSEFTVNFQYHYLKAGNSTTTFTTDKVDLALST
jgi:hypothetical protein